MNRPWGSLQTFRRPQTPLSRRAECLPLWPRHSQETGDGRVTLGHSDPTTTGGRVDKKGRRWKLRKGHRRVIFDQQTIDNTERNHRQECSLRGPHPHCDLWTVPPVELSSLEGSPRRSRITFHRKVIVKPIAHHADIKRRGGEWETLRESLDREDEYFLLLNDEEPEEGDYAWMGEPQSTDEGDSEDQDEVDTKLEELGEAGTEAYCGGQKGWGTADAPPNDGGANDSGVEMPESESESDRIFRNEIVQHTGGIVIGGSTHGPTEGCVVSRSAEFEYTCGASGFDIGGASPGIPSNEEGNREENSFGPGEEDEGLFEGEWEAMGDSAGMAANGRVTVEPLVINSEESLSYTVQLEEGPGEHGEPLSEQAQDEGLFSYGNWEMADSDSDPFKIPIIAEPTLILEVPAVTNNLDSVLGTAHREGDLGAKTHEIGMLERKRGNKCHNPESTANHAHGRAPLWVIKRRKIYPDTLFNRTP